MNDDIVDMRHLVARLRSDPTDRQAYASLRDAYRAQEDYESLANLLEGWAGYCDEPDTASHTYEEAAKVADGFLGDTLRASQLYKNAVYRMPSNTTALSRVIETLEGAGKWQGLADFLEQYIAGAQDKTDVSADTIADAYVRLGRIYFEHVGRSERAARMFRSALQLVPDHKAAQELVTETGEASELARTGTPVSTPSYIEQLAGSLPEEQDPSRRLALHNTLAEARGAAGDFDGAIKGLRQALTEAPGDAKTMHQLAEMLLGRARVAGPADVAKATKDYLRAGELLYQLGQSATRDPEAAFAYAISSLGAVPNHDGALALAEELAPSIGRAAQLPELWLAFIASAGPGPASDRRRVLLGRAYAEAGQIDDAIYCLEAARDNAEANALLTALLGQRDSTVGEIAAVHAPAAASAPAGASAPVRPLGSSGLSVAEANPSPQQFVAQGEPPQHHPPDERAQALARLHGELRHLVTERRHDDAAGKCVEIIAANPGDVEAFNYLESYYRKRRAYPQLRDLLLTSSRVPGLPVDTRKVRLREVAILSEGKLQDADTAVVAYQGVVTLDPSNTDAAQRLKRLLRRTERWDDLVTLLEREVTLATNDEHRLELLNEVAQLRRERSDEPQDYVDVLQQLYDLQPTPEQRDALCEAYLSLQQYHAALPLLEAQLDEATDRHKRRELRRRLARVLEEEVHDPDAAYAVCEALLADDPGDLASLERMARIDEASGNHERLVATLGRRVEVVDAPAQVELLRRMGDLTARALNNPEAAAVHYQRAVALGGGDAVMPALVALYEEFGLTQEHAQWLRSRVDSAATPEERIAPLLQLASLQADTLSDPEAAHKTYAEVLEHGEHPAALRFLWQHAKQSGGPAAEMPYLKRLQAVTSDLSERRELLEELISLQELDLEDTAGAVESLIVAVRDVAPGDEQMLARLSELARRTKHDSGLATALERRLGLLAEQVQGTAEAPDDTGEVATVATELADLCEAQLQDPERAIRALSQWATLCPDSATPERRLRPLLADKGASTALVATLDALANLEESDEARDEARLAAARFAHDLGDANGAWARLGPLVEEGREEAMALLSAVCKAEGWSDRQAGLFVTLAQRDGEVAQQRRFWNAASDVYAQALDRPDQALEADLRSLALDLSDRDALRRVEELSIKAGALPRLAQVYERLLTMAPDSSEQVTLLVRHADLLEGEADQPGAALDQVIRACRLAPEDEALLQRAEALAGAEHRGGDLLPLYDQRSHTSDKASDRVALALRAARVCETQAKDRDQAVAYLKRALRETDDEATLADEVWKAAEAFDQGRPDLGDHAARHALVEAHKQLAQEAPAAFAERLILDAARRQRDLPGSERETDAVLKFGVSLMPQAQRPYEELLASTAQRGRLPQLGDWLSKQVEHASDPMDTAALLEHLADLYDGPLDQPQQAAQTYQRLLQLRSDDLATANRLRATLKRGGRYQDLLVAISRQLRRTEDKSTRVGLLREAAVAWDKGLKNRFEAADAWRRVLEVAPDDEQAAAAVERLGPRRSAASLEELLGEDDDGREPGTAPEAEDKGDEPFPDVEPPRLAYLRSANRSSDSAPAAPAQPPEDDGSHDDTETVGQTADEGASTKPLRVASQAVVSPDSRVDGPDDLATLDEVLGGREAEPAADDLEAFERAVADMPDDSGSDDLAALDNLIAAPDAADQATDQATDLNAAQVAASDELSEELEAVEVVVKDDEPPGQEEQSALDDPSANDEPDAVGGEDLDKNTSH